jgi:hypothetical protein
MNDSFLKIDEFNLDKEWLDQPRLYFEWAQKAADARKDFDETKNALEVTKSEISLQVRDNPEAFGIDSKLTEKVIEAAVLESTQHVRALKKMNDARHAHEVYSVAVSALEHRKRALENLVTLHMANYYSEPRARTQEDKEGMEEVVKQGVRRRGKERRSDDD